MNKLQQTIIANLRAGVCTKAVMLKKAADAEREASLIRASDPVDFQRVRARQLKYAADVRAAVAAV